MTHDEQLGRQALQAAQERYLQELDLAQSYGRFKPDRKAFNRLARACDELIASLDDFHFQPPTHDNWAMLMHGLQETFGSVSKDDCSEAIDRAAEFVAQLRDIAKANGGRGVQANEPAHTWVWIAADQWFKVTGREPSTAENGRFVKALLAMELDKARPQRMPRLSHDVIKAALKERKSRAGKVGGQ